MYSGLGDGNVLIWALDGRPVSVLQARSVVPLCHKHAASDPFETDPVHSWTHPSTAISAADTRHVSWHPDAPILLASGGNSTTSSHINGYTAAIEFKGFGRNGLYSLSD